MRATLFSDASFCHRTHAAGWGAWCKTGDMGFGQTFGGSFKRRLPSVASAELCGLHNALRHALVSRMVHENFEVLLQCDSVEALSLVYAHVPGVEVNPHPDVKRVPIFKTTRKVQPIEKEALERLRKLQKEFSLNLRLRHVKGHSHGGGRSWVNNECDRIAKRHMQEARAAMSVKKTVEHGSETV